MTAHAGLDRVTSKIKSAVSCNLACLVAISVCKREHEGRPWQNTTLYRNEGILGCFLSTKCAVLTCG